MPNFALTKPVLVVAFRRPDFTRQLLEVLARVRPPRLYLALDAPRAGHPGEAEAHAEVRNILEHIPWPCEVFRDFVDQNQGSGRRVPSAVSWMLEHEEDGIILEDDCLPDDTFFPFCEELLNRYRDKQRVVGISGQLGVTTRPPRHESYFFSKYNRTWGWATWRRAWRHYDHDLIGWDAYQTSVEFKQKCINHWEANYWAKSIQMFLDNVVNAWDFRWLMSFWMQDGLIAVAHQNLVANKGFRADSSHTSFEAHGHLQCESTSLSFPLIHPMQVAQDETQDLDFWRHNLKPLNILQRARRKLRVVSRRTIKALHLLSDRILPGAAEPENETKPENWT